MATIRFPSTRPTFLKRRSLRHLDSTNFYACPSDLKTRPRLFNGSWTWSAKVSHGVFVYLDDILVASSDHIRHLQDLRTLFNRLQQFGLVVNPSKCVLGASEIDFLGHHINQQGAIPLPKKVEVIHHFAQPNTI